MNLVSRTSLIRVLVAVWWMSNSGCSATQTVNVPPAPLQPEAAAEGQAPLTSRGIPVDVETFLAFCDRA